MMIMMQHRPDDYLDIESGGHSKDDDRWPVEHYTRALVGSHDSPSSLKRSRSIINEEPDEFHGQEAGYSRGWDCFQTDRADRRSVTERQSLVHPSDLQPSTSSVHLLVSQWSAETAGWQKDCLNEIALLAEIEEQAATYATGGVAELLAPFLPSRIQAAQTHHMPGDGEEQEPQRSALVSAQEKPYKCSLCPKSFTRNYDLTRHKSSHEDERQHVCRHCGRSFNRRDALSRHNLVRGCGSTLNQAGLTRHRSAHRARPRTVHHGLVTAV